MDIGDPKKAKVLAIVAGAIVAVAIYRLIPGGGSFSPGVADSAMPGVEMTSDGLPGTVFVDAFFHPTLAELAEQAGPAAQPGDDAQPAPTSSFQGEPRGGGPLLPLFNTMGTFVQPEVNTGNARESTQEAKKISVSLEATLDIDGKIAMISVDGQPAAARRVGDKFGASAIEQITDDGVVFKASGGRSNLKVGQTIEL